MQQPRLSSTKGRLYIALLIGAIGFWLFVAKPWQRSTPPASPQSSSLPSNTLTISSLDLGDKWPLTVGHGILSCINPSSVVFESNGIRYAVNGTAKTLTEFPDIDSIWAADPSIAGAKKDIGPLIERGQQLCK